MLLVGWSKFVSYENKRAVKRFLDLDFVQEPDLHRCIPWGHCPAGTYLG